MSVRKRLFYGKYRGIVDENMDPMMLGRITAKVPDVFGTDVSGWALPCVPFAGSGSGMCIVPPKGSWVWIEFEGGDPEYPIWTGGFWGMAKDVPSAVPPPPYKKLLIKTEGGNQLLLDDTPGVGGLTVQTMSGEKLTMTPLGITMQTKAGCKLELSTTGITLQGGTAGPKLVLAAQGVELSTSQGGSVKISANIVKINDGALEVM